MGGVNYVQRLRVILSIPLVLPTLGRSFPRSPQSAIQQSSSHIVADLAVHRLQHRRIPTEQNVRPRKSGRLAWLWRALCRERH